MKDEACIFCKLAAGEIPSATIYEDQEFRVLLDLNPATRGHALILPKEHFMDIFEMPEEWVAKAFALAKRMSEKMKEVLGCDGLNIVQNNGAVAGQTVFHFHIHLIPRYENDGAGINWTQGTLTEEEKTEILRSFQ